MQRNNGCMGTRRFEGKGELDGYYGSGVSSCRIVRIDCWHCLWGDAALVSISEEEVRED